MDNTLEHQENIPHIYTLPLERLQDILSLCKDQWGLIRLVDTTFKNLIDAIPIQATEKSQNSKHKTKTKTQNFMFLSSLESYEYLSKHATPTSQTLINAIKHKTLSIEVARVLFPTTLMTRKVLFTLGETSSVELLKVLAEKWPFVSSAHSPNKWKKFVIHCLTSYSNDVLDWLKENQHLFFDHNDKSFQVNVKSLIDSSKFPFYKSCSDLDRLIQISKEFNGYQTVDLIGELKSVNDLIRVVTKGTFTNLNNETSYKLPVLLNHFVDQEGRMSFVKNWDDLGDKDKLNHLGQFKDDVYVLCQTLGLDYINYSKTIRSLFSSVYFEANWVKGFEWARRNFICTCYFHAKRKISREMINHCLKIPNVTENFCAKSFVNRIIMTGDIKLFEDYIINIPNFQKGWALLCIRLDLLEENQHILEWLINHHFEFFCKMLPSKEITIFQTIWESFNDADSPIRGAKRYEAILYWLIIIQSHVRRDLNCLPWMVFIGNKIARGKFGDPKENSEIFKFLINCFQSEEEVPKRPFSLNKIKSLEHFEIALPLFLPHLEDIDFQSVLDSLSTVDKCQKFIHLLKDNKALVNFTRICWKLREKKSDQIEYLLMLRKELRNVELPVHSVLKALIKWNRLDLLSEFFTSPIDNLIYDYGTVHHLNIFNEFNNSFNSLKKGTKRQIQNDSPRYSKKNK